MIKVLLKKQLQEFSSRYLVDTKTKKLRSKGGMIGMLLLMAFLFVVLMGSFGMFSLTLAGGFIEQGRDWMFFALQGVFALFMGVLGSVFTTFQTLFQPKDNELLLSMPIKPRDILLTRMVGVYLMAFLYSGLVLIPSTVVYWILAKPGMGVVLSTLLLWFVQALFTTVLTCGLGYVIALIASKIKGKSAVTVILSLLFIGGYYYV